VTAADPSSGSGPVLFAYDGSELAKLAIDDRRRLGRRGASHEGDRAPQPLQHVGGRR
jgi:hypothetical protein